MTFPGIRQLPQGRKGGAYELHGANSGYRGKTEPFRDRCPDTLCGCLDFLAAVWASEESFSPGCGPEVVPRRAEDALHDSLTSMDAQSETQSGSDHGREMRCVVWPWRVNLEVKRLQGAIDCHDRAWTGLFSGSIIVVRVAGRVPSSFFNSETDVSRLAIAA